MKKMLTLIPVLMLTVTVVPAEPLEDEARFHEPGYVELMTFDEIFNEITGFYQEPEGAQGK